MNEWCGADGHTEIVQAMDNGPIIISLLCYYPEQDETDFEKLPLFCPNHSLKAVFARDRRW